MVDRHPMPKRASPLDDFRDQMAAFSADASVRLHEQDLAKVNLRGNPHEAMFLRKVRPVLDLDLPIVPNTTTRTSRVSALWLGPDEWMIVGAPGVDDDLAAELRAALAGVHSSIVEVSADSAVLEISGPRSRDVLMKGCSIDLHPRAFAPGHCVQTIVGRVSVILEQTDAAPTWRLFVRASFAPYLAQWLLDAMSEFAAGAQARSAPP